jgi:biopolymer transport protein ExbD
MAVKISHGRALATLSLTSLIDVVFLLLIFFILATRFVSEEDRELDVILPSASEARPLTSKPKEVFINIDQHGQYLVGGKTLSLDEVETYLRQAAIDNPIGQSVQIRADKRAAVDSAVGVMNACNKAGLTNYYLTTTAPEGSGP